MFLVGCKFVDHSHIPYKRLMLPCQYLRDTPSNNFINNTLPEVSQVTCFGVHNLLVRSEIKVIRLKGTVNIPFTMEGKVPPMINFLYAH